MPSLSERERNNIRAGVFVTISLIICLAVLTVLTNVTDNLFHSMARYTVTFPVSSGVGNMKKGSEVRVGGVRKGKVLKVIAPYEDQGAFRTIGIEFELEQNVTLYENARVIVGVPILGNDTWIEIPHVGDSSTTLPPGGIIPGTPTVGLLTTLVGVENAHKVDEVVGNVTRFSDFLGGFDQEYANRYVPIVDDIGEMAAHGRTVVADLHENRWLVWANAVDHVLTQVSEASEQLNAALADGKAMLADGRDIVAENRGPIKETLANAQSISERLNTETLDKFHALLDTGQTGLNSAVAVLRELETDYPIWAADVTDALASANLASQQVKLTMIETRRAPWKLLYKPTASEVEHELLYDSVRSFAMAATELKSTSEAIRRILDNHGDKVASDQDTFRRLEQMLSDDLANYQKAQQKMFDVLLSERKP